MGLTSMFHGCINYGGVLESRSSLYNLIFGSQPIAGVAKHWEIIWISGAQLLVHFIVHPFEYSQAP